MIRQHLRYTRSDAGRSATHVDLVKDGDSRYIEIRTYRIDANGAERAGQHVLTAHIPLSDGVSPLVDEPYRRQIADLVRQFETWFFLAQPLPSLQPPTTENRGAL